MMEMSLLTAKSNVDNGIFHLRWQLQRYDKKPLRLWSPLASNNERSAGMLSGLNTQERCSCIAQAVSSFGAIGLGNTYFANGWNKLVMGVESGSMEMQFSRQVRQLQDPKKMEDVNDDRGGDCDFVQIELEHLLEQPEMTFMCCKSVKPSLSVRRMHSSLS